MCGLQATLILTDAKSPQHLATYRNKLDGHAVHVIENTKGNESSPYSLHFFAPSGYKRAQTLMFAQLDRS